MLIYTAPTSVQNSLVTLTSNTINITWSLPTITNGMILQYIVRRINSSGKSYHYVSRDKHYLELPYFNDALVFVSAVNQYGQSSFEQANSNGMNNICMQYFGSLHSLVITQLLVCHHPALIMEHVLLRMLPINNVFVLAHFLGAFVNPLKRLDNIMNICCNECTIIFHHSELTFSHVALSIWIDSR